MGGWPSICSSTQHTIDPVPPGASEGSRMVVLRENRLTDLDDWRADRFHFDKKAAVTGVTA
jgi:hypothetical protein